MHDRQSSFRQVPAMHRPRAWALVVVACLFVLANLLTAQPTPPSRVIPLRTIEHAVLMVDTSFSMAGRAESLQEAIQVLILQGVQGRLAKGDVLHLWTFSEQVNTSVFPSRTWDPATNESLARQILAFTSNIKFEKQTRLDRALRAMLAAAESVDRATFIILSDGLDTIRGTPFDSEINADYRSRRRELRRERDALVTILNSERGQFTGWMVSAASDVIKSGLKLQAPESPAPAPLADNRAAQPSASVPQAAPTVAPSPPAPAPSANTLPAEPPPTLTTTSKPLPALSQPAQSTKPTPEEAPIPSKRESTLTQATPLKSADSKAAALPDPPSAIPTPPNPAPAPATVAPEPAATAAPTTSAPATPPVSAPPPHADSVEKPTSEARTSGALLQPPPRPLTQSPPNESPPLQSAVAGQDVSRQSPTSKTLSAGEAKPAVEPGGVTSGAGQASTSPELTRQIAPSLISSPAERQLAPPESMNLARSAPVADSRVEDGTPPRHQSSTPPPQTSGGQLPPAPAAAAVSSNTRSTPPPAAIVEPAPTVAPVVRSWWIGILFLLLAAAAFWTSWRKSHRRTTPSLISRSIGENSMTKPAPQPHESQRQPPSHSSSA